jgi:hypothetical protein
MGEPARPSRTGRNGAMDENRTFEISMRISKASPAPPRTHILGTRSDYLPFIGNFAGISVACSMLGGESTVSISCEPEGYPGLKSDARAIRAREGKGARVDYVAWSESDAV